MRADPDLPADANVGRHHWISPDIDHQDLWDADGHV
jgi:hypothetical protein